jgi:hypothetical protein
LSAGVRAGSDGGYVALLFSSVSSLAGDLARNAPPRRRRFDLAMPAGDPGDDCKDALQQMMEPTRNRGEGIVLAADLGENPSEFEQ